MIRLPLPHPPPHIIENFVFEPANPLAQTVVKLIRRTAAVRVTRTPADFPWDRVESIKVPLFLLNSPRHASKESSARRVAGEHSDGMRLKRRRFSGGPAGRWSKVFSVNKQNRYEWNLFDGFVIVPSVDRSHLLSRTNWDSGRLKCKLRNRDMCVHRRTNESRLMFVWMEFIRRASGSRLEPS